MMTFAEIAALSKVMGWTWTRLQAEILGNLTRYVEIVGGRRAGKSLFTARLMFIYIVEAIQKWIEAGEPLVEGGEIPFWFVGKSYELCEREYRYLESDLTRRFGVRNVQATSRAIGPNEITLDCGKVKVVVRTKSAADEQSLEAEAPAAVAVCEAAQVGYSAYLRLLGRITERRAPLILSGSLESDFGWYNDMMVDWSTERSWKEDGARSWILPSQTNLFAFPLGPDDPELLERKRQMSEDDFNRFFMGRPAPPRGLVHAMFRSTVHVRDVPYLTDVPVWLALDPGIAGPEKGGSAYAVFACQITQVREIHPQLRVFDSMYVDNVTEDAVIETVMARPWWKTSDIYGVIDRKGSTREGGKPSSVTEWLRRAGLRLRYSTAAVQLRDQRARFDSLLKVNDITKEPGIVMDARRTKGLQSELGGCASPLRPDAADQVYRWRIDPQGVVIGKEPRDMYCDAIKAVYYLAWDRFGSIFPRNTARGPLMRRHRTLTHAVPVWGREA